jgi:hypothetical protein
MLAFIFRLLGVVVGYTHISALLLGFPKQFGKATFLSVILKRGSEYKCVKGMTNKKRARRLFFILVKAQSVSYHEDKSMVSH